LFYVFYFTKITSFSYFGLKIFRFLKKDDAWWPRRKFAIRVLVGTFRSSL